MGKATLTAPRALLFTHTHTHTHAHTTIHSFNICALHQQHAYSKSGLETGARGCRSTSLLLSPALSLSLSLDLPLSIFLSFFVWKVSVKGSRWKAALSGSVIAETALAAQGASRIAHSELLRPDKDTRRHCPQLVHMQRCRDAQFNCFLRTRIYIPAACRLFVHGKSQKYARQSLWRNEEDVMCCGTLEKYNEMNSSDTQ